MSFINDKDLPIFRSKLSREEVVQLKEVFQTAINELAERLGIAESGVNSDSTIIQTLLQQNATQDGSLSQLVDLLNNIQTALSGYANRLVSLEANGPAEALESRVLLIEKFIDGNINVLDLSLIHI